MTMTPRNGREALALADASADRLVPSRAGAPQSIPVVRRESGKQESTMKILLAEDSPIYRHLISGHLKEWGFDVQIANDGAVAWELLQAPDAPKLALLDWVLPKIEGIELCRRLREVQAHSDYTYVILLTGKDGKDDLVAGMRAGADDLIKPFHPRNWKRVYWGERESSISRGNWYPRENHSELRRPTIFSLGC